MLEQGKYNEAFTKALMASDLPLVVELMEMVDSSKIFSPDLPGGTALEGRGDNTSNTSSNSIHSSNSSISQPFDSKSTFKSEVSIPNLSKGKNSNRSGYDTFNNEYVTSADAFFNPHRPSLARRSDHPSSDSGIISDTEQKLSQFFLLNKY